MNYDNKMPQIEENISHICSNLRILVSRIDNLKSKAFELSIKEDEIGNLKGQKLITFSEHLNILNLNIQDIVNNIKICEEFTDLCFKDLIQVLPWLPEKRNDLEVILVEGNSPWSFWVSYTETTELEILQKALEQKHEEGLLKNLVNSPEVGTFVCCHDRKLFFRGLVIGVLPDERLKILGVDTKCIKIAKLENVYELNQELCRFHANVVHCCLTNDTAAKDLWNEDLSGIFKSVLRECKLKMDVVSELECFPPKFMVKISAQNNLMKVNLNLNEWVCEQLLPEIESLEELCKEEDLISLLSEVALDPYATADDIKEVLETKVKTPKENSPTVKVENTMIEFIESSEANSQDMDKKSINLLKKDSSSGLKEEANEFIPSENSNVYGNYPNYHQRNSYSEQDIKTKENEPTDELKTNLGVNTYHSESILESKFMYVNRENARLADKGIPGNKGDGNIEPSQEINQNMKPGNRCSDDQQEPLNSTLEHHIMTEEESCIGGEYNPTDEIRICQFYAKRGFCWKVGCSKEHSEPAMGDKWTTDKVSVFKESFNCISLPIVGETIFLQVTFVSSGNCFIALLPDKYSDIGEYTDNEQETLSSLLDTLNSTEQVKQFQYLDADACLGELILVCNSQGIWLRARVCELFDTAVEVYYVDYGTSEIVPNSKKRLRKISPQFLHLPFQAVLCFLSDICVTDDDILRDKSIAYLETLILNKVVEGTVIKRSVVDSELQLIVRSEGININEIMVSQGFCSKF